MATILVIDDDPTIVEAMRAALEIQHYTVIGTVDADMAPQLAHTYHPHLILLDYLLSGSNGTTVIEGLKKDPLTAKIPLILLSAHPKAREEAKRMGATAFIPKPFDLSLLYTMIRKYT
ncbi:two-component system response regulator [Candidatus Cerribacteria bacterium 'Amazon FNV 2010 28 9']|uniref:Two-component system response regulator n=1 Tax=Candidatus Cerribacteria bacterium 'Amazon FNV 2010 28 9' TaxID=2081795 RepID=A0A317JPE1_9BACT|nr:MAG: two-component system response regulator [Candidatus Cerribacteria bacterium 'Amazon FNV 2010 28 9']